MIVSERVSERMQRLGLSQSELARRVGVAQPTIYKLLRSSKKGSTHLHQIARELQTTPAYLSGEVDDPEANAPPPPVLDHDELAWVEYWRALDSDGRDAMVRVVRLLTAGGQGGQPQLRGGRS
jgi:transcriptional regulator with XRE-family HTH domain